MIVDDWKQLAANALIGTGKKEPVLAAEAPGADPESRLLAMAALSAICRRAGWMQTSSALEPLDASPAETNPIVWGGELHLHQLLTKHRSLLPEWLAEAARCKVLAPPSSCPALLDMAVLNSGARQQIMAVVGQRGRWLAALNPSWSELLIESLPAEAWESGSLPDRIRLLVEGRADDPAKGRELIQSSWIQDPAAHRAAFLLALEPALSPDDQDFLEQALTDRSVEVRRAAVSLLARIPSSSIAQQAIELALSCVGLYKSFLGTKVEIHLPPEDPTPFDILNESVEGAGVRAAKLARVMGCVSPKTWQAETERTMGELYQIVGKHELSREVRRGFEISAIRFGDIEAANAIFQFWLEKPDGALPEIWPLVSSPIISQARQALIKAKSRSAPMLLNLGKPWDTDTSRAFLRAYVSIDQAHLGLIEPSEAARRLSLETIEGALASITPELERPLKSWLEILPLRRDMIATIRRSANR